MVQYVCKIFTSTSLCFAIKYLIFLHQLDKTETIIYISLPGEKIAGSGRKKWFADISHHKYAFHVEMSSKPPPPLPDICSIDVLESGMWTVAWIWAFCALNMQQVETSQAGFSIAQNKSTATEQSHCMKGQILQLIFYEGLLDISLRSTAQ
jgi:hypothetical protein